jgi:hypothetical protein
MIDDKTQPERGVQTIRVTSADEVMQVLSPTGRYLKDFLNATWIFRGVTDGSHELIPAALRQRQKKFCRWVNSSINFNPDERNRDLIMCELLTLKEFCAVADAHGLEIPGHVYDFWPCIRSFEEKLEGGNKDPLGWPDPKLLFALALMQHHGLPTRLLDWTRNPLIACYFAAQRPDASKPNFLAVWAYHGLTNDVLGWIASSHPVRMVTVPRYNNANLRARRGFLP